MLCIARFVHSRFGLTGLLLFQEALVDVDAGWDRLVPPRIRHWALDGEVRTWAPSELMEHSTLRNRDAWHAAYVRPGGAAARHRSEIRPGPARGGIDSESRRSARVGSAGHVLRRIRHERVQCEDARHRLGRSLHAFGARVTFCYVMPAGVCVRNAQAHRVRVPMRPCKSACSCARVCCVPPAAETCVCRGSRVQAGFVGGRPALVDAWRV